MRSNKILGLVALSLALLAGRSMQAQPYSNAVMSLNPPPVGYWPLNETAQPPQLLNLTATNIGALGASANGYYGAWYQPSGNTWYLTNNISQVPAVTALFDGSVAMNCQRAPGQYVMVPRNTNGVANPGVTLNPPFSIEAWLKIGTIGGALGTIVSQGGFVNVNTGGSDTNNPYYGGLGTGWAGVELGQYQDYLFLICNATNGASKGNELDTSGYNTFTGFHVGDWVHVVATFDGTNEVIWTNGVMSVSKSLGNNGAGIKYVADPTTPLMIGSGSDISASYGIAFQGAIHDVAIYTNVLGQQSIDNHYQTAFGTNATFGSVYTNAVLADTPALYYRLNDAQSVINGGYPANTFPVATNYGSAGVAGGGVYQPGTTPGVAGPAYSGFGAKSKSVAINGFLGAVDVGGGSLPASLNPTGYSPFTAVSWFRGAPADSPGRYQGILGHGNNSYRFGLGQTAGETHFNPGPLGSDLQVSAADTVNKGFALNDGKWHMVAGVCDGTNVSLYLDGLLATNTTTSGVNITGSAADLLLGGDSQFTVANASSANTIRNLDGEIAQVAFWSNALSQAQIQQLYNAAGVPPVIAQQPQSINTNAGSVVALTVAVRGSAPFTYQWYKGSSQVTGATSSTLLFNPIGLGNAGAYHVAITNVSGYAISANATVTVVGPPAVNDQSPTDVKVFAGTTPTLYVSASGPSLSYLWSLNDTPISGATSSNYKLPAVSANGTYTCSVTNSYGNAGINPISVTVLTDPAAAYPQTVLQDHPIAYYRLDEASGTTAYDYAGGLNATYTNASLGNPGYSANDPTVTSAGFGSSFGGLSVDSFAGDVPQYLNFGAPAGSATTFSVEVWVNGGYGETLDGGIVALGYGNGGEEFDLDTGGSDPSHNFRWIVRDASGAAHVVNGTTGPKDNNWHHVVGVCDQPNAALKLYVDGVLENSTGFNATAGVFAPTAPMSIGSRQSGQGTPYDNQFSGYVNDVAVYNYALSSTQVQNHYLIAGIAPVITLQPTNSTFNDGGTAFFYAAATGTAPLSYQWYDVTTVTTPVRNQTNATLVLSNINATTMNGNVYQLIVTNLYGSTSSQNAQLEVVAGPPYIQADLQPLFLMGYADTPFTYSVTVSGSAPLHYQWKLNGANIPGATNASYSGTNTVGTNYYVLAVTNSAGFALSSVATNIGVVAPTLNPADYTYKMKITFHGYSGNATLTNFPALVLFGTNAPGFSYSQLSSPTAADLRFTDASGTREIPHEIDEWNTSGSSAVWVQVPSLASTNDYIWAYWGNPADTVPAAWTTNGQTWVPAFGSSPAYEVVYHLKEGALPFADGTTLHPATNGVAPTATPGVVGTGGMFNGSAWLDAGTNDIGDNITFSAWVNVTPGTSSIQTLWANQHGGYGAPGFALFVNTYGNSDQKIDLASGDGNGGGNESATAQGAVAFGSWHLIEVAVNRTNGTAEFYYDGTDIYSSSSVVKDFNTLQDLRLSYFLDNNFPMHGAMDEARVRGAVSSANWVLADYMTVAQNSTFENYSAVSSSAVIITGQMIGNKLVLTWPQGTLLSGTEVAGITNVVSGAMSPYTNTVTNSREFFRVKVR